MTEHVEARRELPELPPPKRRKGDSANRELSNEIDVLDFFCGCGGASAGFRKAGMRIALGIDVDEIAEATFRTNFPEASFLRRDIRKVRTAEIEPFATPKLGRARLFAACAPCQPFSRQRRDERRNDDRSALLQHFGRFVNHFRPDFVFVENVPGLQAVGVSGPFGKFLAMLRKNGYYVAYGVVECCDYGVPQRRRRLIVMASRLGPIALPMPSHGPNREFPHATVWQSIGDLPALDAGQQHPDVPNHVAAGLSPINKQRIRSTPPEGSRRDWPKRLRLECHGNGYQGHSDVYGRMRKHAPATGLTTRCISLSNGRFGHPIQHRAISVREAACLQTFDRTFVFHGSMAAMARQIGNAVPVLLAERVGTVFFEHREELVR